ncbi:MAG TPA: alpha/beta hydrolase [Streptosporangiaceae bacterium]|nr:alpha/beta hydrolase [Streptosporangiaceae bacterium]
MSTPTSLSLPDSVRRTVIETSRGGFAALEAMPGTGVCERQPAVLVPGFTGSKEDFLAILHQLGAAGRRVLAIDLRGQYQTPGPDDPGAYAIGELGADVAAIVAAVAARVAAPAGPAGPDGVGLGPVHLVGHSFGGLIVREAMLSGAASVGSVTLMSSGPAQLTGPAAAELTSLLSYLDGSSPEVMRHTIEQIWDTTLGPLAAAAGVEPEIVAFLRERMLGNAPVGLQVMAQYLLRAPDRTTELAGALHVPVLVLYGENDDKWEPAAQEEMASRLGASRVCIPGAAHSPAVEAPETTASALNSFWHTAEGGPDQARQRTGTEAYRG